MFSRKSSKSKIQNPVVLKNLEKDFESMKPLCITLGNNRLTLVDGKQWVYDSSDLDVLTQEILALENEREEFKLCLEAAENRSDALKQNLANVTKLKTVTMDMLTEERIKTTRLEKELSCYKDELAQSYRIILQLRKIIDINEVEVEEDEPPKTSLSDHNINTDIYDNEDEH
mmetsp:Transcript_37465/g.38151  ORF Transcript_37465/g.38151 Transcript_37465/m.38151 type:complete len:172 (-) Transcript_37465:103-618(-)|eukprot:CAMPEP_0182419186 /NCGR_PEP_ID=MMETSP1167-20130531/3591_1 /TAXON_ID=2988 /ORGANISM="Mallomonas Sp, Strain CCMP3275" /LENGTH=171 /DNA_ID=CAMNT_0024593869 /DNA_START=125 /DNA_END=640 /DNA_ORIENTATION=+